MSANEVRSDQAVEPDRAAGQPTSDPAAAANTADPGSVNPAQRSDGYDRPPDNAPQPGGNDWENRWRRTAADLDNLRKRQAGEVDAASERERRRVAAEWLPVLDNLELALTHAGADTSPVVEGIRAVRDQAIALLARLGYERRDDVGSAFDPARHEVVTVVDVSEAEPGTVVAVLRPGYGDGDRMLRPVAVAVARRPE